MHLDRSKVRWPATTTAERLTGLSPKQIHHVARLLGRLRGDDRLGKLLTAPPSVSGTIAVHVERQRKGAVPQPFRHLHKWTPAESRIVANVWRRSCSRTPSTAGTAVASCNVVAGLLAGSPTATRLRAAVNVDGLSDAGFPVERVRIIGHDMYSVEQVTGRLTKGRAALLGAGGGAWWGLMIGLLLAIFAVNASYVITVLAVGLVIGALFGAIFASWRTGPPVVAVTSPASTTWSPRRYTVEVDAGYLEEAVKIADRPFEPDEARNRGRSLAAVSHFAAAMRDPRPRPTNS